MSGRIQYYSRSGSKVIILDELERVRDLNLSNNGLISRFLPISVDEAISSVKEKNILEGAELKGSVENWTLTANCQGNGILLGKDLSPDFTLNGGHTLFIELDSASAEAHEAKINYVDSIWGTNIPVVPDKYFGFVGHFGLARACGLISLVFEDDQGHYVGSFEQALNFGHVGGKDLSGYSEERVVGLAPKGAATARIEIALTKFVEDESGIQTAYLFMTRPRFGHMWPADRFPWRLRASGVEKFWDALAKEAISGNRQGPAPFGQAQAKIDFDSKPHLKIVDSSTGSTEVTVRMFEASTQTEGLFLDVHHNEIVLSAASGTADFLIYVDGKEEFEVKHDFTQTNTRRGLFLTPSSDGRLTHLAVVDAGSLEVRAQNYQHLAPHVTPWEVLQAYVVGGPRLTADPLGDQRSKSLLAFLNSSHSAEWRSKSSVRYLLDNVSIFWKILSTGFLKNSKFPKLKFPKCQQPEVSIVIPVHNKFEVTYHCLVSLLTSWNDRSFEIVLVDDGSTDRTEDIEDYVENLKVVRHSHARGFVHACNAGAQKAVGKYLLFLNNDTEVTFKAVDLLVEALEADAKIGIVGSKLINANGTLQDAGGIVWSSGNPWNVGRNNAALDPRYAYSRDVDYVTGAALMIPRDLFERVGKFSEEFAPGYFEDTDLCFKVVAEGLRVRYVSGSVIVHFEGQTSGTSTSSGMKKFQEINRPKFKRKWSGLYRNYGKEGELPDLEKDRACLGRVLMIDWQTPRPDVDAGSFAAIEEVKLIQSLGYKVTFLPMNFAYMDHYTQTLTNLGAEVIYAPYFISLNQFFEARGQEFDVVYVTRFNVAEQCLDYIERFAPRAKKILCNADLHFLREMRAAVISDKVGTEREKEISERTSLAEETKVRELATMKRFDLTLSYSDSEIAIVKAIEPRAIEMARAPWVVRTRQSIPSFEEREGIAFLGGFAHPPNLQAVNNFATNIFPHVQAAIPGIKFYVYGSEMAEQLAHLKADGIEKVGFIENVEDMYDRHRLFVVPLLSGAGIKGKLISAIGNGLPSIVSPIAAEGTTLRDGLECRVVARTEEWVEAISDLYLNEEKWMRMSQAALHFAEANHSADVGRVMMKSAFETIGLF